MIGITAAELAAMRDIADTFFPDTCDLYDPADSVDSTGSPTETFGAATYSGVACRVDPATVRGQGEQITALALEGESIWMLNIPYNQTINITYQVVHNGKTYQVRQVVDTQSYSTIRRALMVRVN